MSESNGAIIETLTGMVERVTFRNEENGFCILQVKVRGQKDLTTVVGSVPSINLGEFVDCRGSWHNHKKFGMQFQANEHLHVVPPATLEGIEKYLASGMVKGIGPHFAKTLVKAFGKDVFDVIENHPKKLLKLPGIGQKRVEKITDAWAEQKVVRDIMIFLQSHGIGSARAVRIYKTYGDNAIAKINENPYRLASDIHGVGFKIADDLALSLGIPADSLIRAQAGVRHTLQEAAGQGHCACERTDLIETASNLLGIPSETIEQALGEELAGKRLVVEQAGEQEHVYLTYLHKAETQVAKRLKRLLEGALPWGKIDIDKAVPKAEKSTGIKLSDSQRAAVKKALESKLAVLTGGPGTGKTTITQTFLQIVRSKKLKVCLCAPTGKAAKRMAEATGMETKTIHRTLEFSPMEGGFQRNQENPLEADLVVVDESSMIDIVLMQNLLAAIPDHAALLIIGDVDQLPSVGAGAVLADIIGSEVVPTMRLTEIFRQAATSKIIVNAHRINEGKMPLPNEPGEDSDFYFIPARSPEEVYDKLLKVVTDRLPKSFGFDPIRDIQVLSPMNRASLGTQALNSELQLRLNVGDGAKVTKFGMTYMVGDKVIQTTNNYDKEVFNGDIGTIRSVSREDETLLIDIDDRLVEYDFSDLDEVSLAYATTIHKSQGSEYPVVVIPLAMQHYNLLQKNLIYTGVTRGKKMVVVVGEPRALSMAINNKNSRSRLTGLAQKLAA